PLILQCQLSYTAIIGYAGPDTPASPPQEWRRHTRAGDFLAYDAPELANLLLHRRSLATEHFEDQARIIGKPASPESEPSRQVHIGAGPLPDAFRLLLRRAYEHVAEHIE